MRIFLAKFGVKKKEDIYLLDNNPTKKETEAAFKAIQKRLSAGKKATPRVNYLLVCVFAGHGINKGGT